MTNPPGHLWRDRWTAPSGPLSEHELFSETLKREMPEVGAELVIVNNKLKF